MRYLDVKAVKTKCKEINPDAQVSTEFLIALDVKVEDIIKRSTEWYTNKKRITEMVTK